MIKPLNMRPLKVSEIAEAFAMWAKANGYKHYSLGTRQISETEIVVEVKVLSKGSE